MVVPLANILIPFMSPQLKILATLLFQPKPMTKSVTVLNRDICYSLLVCASRYVTVLTLLRRHYPKLFHKKFSYYHNNIETTYFALSYLANASSLHELSQLQLWRQDSSQLLVLSPITKGTFSYDIIDWFPIFQHDIITQLPCSLMRFTNKGY